MLYRSINQTVDVRRYGKSRFEDLIDREEIIFEYSQES